MSKQYDLNSFAGRLAAIAAGETLRVERGRYSMEYALDEDCLVYPKCKNARGYPLEELKHEGTWSLAPKPERTVTITRKQFDVAVRKLWEGGYPIVMHEIAEELGLGEEEG